MGYLDSTKFDNLSVPHSISILAYVSYNWPSYWCPLFYISHKYIDDVSFSFLDNTTTLRKFYRIPMATFLFSSIKPTFALPRFRNFLRLNKLFSLYPLVTGLCCTTSFSNTIVLYDDVDKKHRLYLLLLRTNHWGILINVFKRSFN